MQVRVVVSGAGFAAADVQYTASMSWFGYDQVSHCYLIYVVLRMLIVVILQGVFSGVLISPDFKYWLPETNNSNISGIVSSCFAVSQFRGAVATRCSD
jgi:hypothetical protein